MSAKVAFILPFVFVMMILSSCFKSQDFPVEPIISEATFLITGDSAVLSFNFTDGDGDIGLADDEKNPPYDSSSYYYYNLYCL